MKKKIALSLFVIAASGAYVLAQPRETGDVLGSALPTDDVPTGSVAEGAAGVAQAPATKPALPSVAFAPSRSGGDDAPVSAVSASAPLRAIVAADGGQAPATKRLPPSIAPVPSRSEDDDGPARGSRALAALPDAAPAPVVASAVLPDRPAERAAADPAPVLAAADPPPPAPVVPASAIVDVPLPRPRPEYRVTRASATRSEAAAMRTEAAATRPEVIVAAGSGYTDGTYTGPAADAYYGLVQVQAIVQGGRLTEIKVLRYPSDRRTSQYINRQALPMLRDEAIRAQSARVDIISGATLSSRAFIRSLDAALKQAKATA